MLINNSKIDEIQLYAEKFRLAIEQCDKKILPLTFRYFPKGSCGDTCLILGQYLKDSNLGVLKYILGKTYKDNQNYSTHAWLKQSQVIVDITADQFNNVQQKVIVTTNSNWHKKFHIQSETIADLETYDSHTQAELLDCYYKIKRYIL
jgi:hypothetical protein